MTSKEAGNILVDRHRLKDLDELKAMGGPFTSSQEVDMYLRTRSKKKEERFYLEMRYARDTSLTVPKSKCSVPPDEGPQKAAYCNICNKLEDLP